MAFLHRWLGIAGNLLFVVWFASALVMMYARMPALDPGDRLNRLPLLDVPAVAVEPAEAAAAAGLAEGGPDPLRIRLGMAGDRPIYRFRTAAGWTAVYADNGSPMLQLPEEQATAIAAGFVRQAPGETGRRTEAAYDDLLNRPDQWTLQLTSLLPVHRVVAGGNTLYVSDRTAEVVMETTPASRFWGTAGAVLHWLYFTPLRSHSAFWYRLIVWTASLGCVVTLSGLAAGVLRLRRRRSPYTGIMRWHHYSGLVFGTAAFTWVLSGALSMDPFQWQAGRSTSSAQHSAVAGGASAVGQPDLASIRTALESVSTGFPPREVEFLRFAGEPLMLAYRPPTGDGRGYGGGAYAAGPLSFQSVVQPLEHRLVTLDGGALRRFSRGELLAAARAAMPASNLVDAVELDDYDAYYDDRRRRRLPLPVLRVRFDDPAATWLYLSPSLGRIVHREQRESRIDRWLYRGLHRLDFPGFYHRRPLWDAVVIVLLLGGLFSAGSSLAPAARRLRRHAARLRRQGG